MRPGGGVEGRNRVGLLEAGEVVDDSALMERTSLRVEGEQQDLLELETTSGGRDWSARP